MCFLRIVDDDITNEGGPLFVTWMSVLLHSVDETGLSLLQCMDFSIGF